MRREEGRARRGPPVHCDAERDATLCPNVDAPLRPDPRFREQLTARPAAAQKWSGENMTRHHGFVRSITIAAACTVGLVLGVRAADPANFKPDAVFKGSALTGWQTVGDAAWTAQNGEIIGKAKPGTNGGWLVLDKRFQDVQLPLVPGLA